MQSPEQKRTAQRLAMQRLRDRDPEAAATKWRIWRAANRDKVNAARAAWRIAHPGCNNRPNKNAARAKRRALTRLLTATTDARTLSGNGLYAAVAAAVPKSLPPDVRDDVIQAMVIATLEGSLAAGNMKSKASSFVTAHYRMFDQRKTRSVDEIVPGTDNLRMIDTIASDVMHF